MSASPNECLHLSVDIVREIHVEVISQFGGLDGVRDVVLLESAVAAPQAGFGGVSLYPDLVEIAAACLFYLCRNHPFLDGNKRAALGACLVFLRLNGVEPTADGPEWERLTQAVATSGIDREAATHLLRAILKPRDSYTDNA
jgi:death-on-curing protein